MNQPKFKPGDLVTLSGHAEIRSRRANISKPIPAGVIGYVLKVFQSELSKYMSMMNNRQFRYDVLVRFDGYGPAIEVEEGHLKPASLLDQLTREI